MTGTTSGDGHPALDRAHAHALAWLASLDERRVPPTAGAARSAPSPSEPTCRMSRA